MTQTMRWLLSLSVLVLLVAPMAQSTSHETCEFDPEEGDGSTALPDGFPRQYQGDHVSFWLDACGIYGYSVDGNPLFSITSKDSTSVGWTSFAEDEGNVEISGADATLKLSKTPTGVLQFDPHGNDFYFVGLAGINYYDSQESGDQLIVLFEADGFKGRIYADPSADLESSIEGYEDYPVGRTNDPVRLVVTESPAVPEEESETAESIADGHIAGEVILGADGTTFSTEHGDISIRVEHTEGELVATVDGEGDGRTFMFNLEQRTVLDLDDLVILFDGEPIGQADGYEDVLDTSDGVAEYFIVESSGRIQVLVQVPSFSVHTIALQGATMTTDSIETDSVEDGEGADAASTPSIGALATLGALGAVVALRRR